MEQILSSFMAGKMQISDLAASLCLTAFYTTVQLAALHNTTCK